MSRGLPRTGRYRHFKGREYEVVAVVYGGRPRMTIEKEATLCHAYHSETEEVLEVVEAKLGSDPNPSFYVMSEEDLGVLVLYSACYGDKRWWLRPIEMFLDEVERDGYSGPRFSYLESS